MLTVKLLSVLLFLTIATGSRSSTIAITCDAGMFTVGKPASVTCYFNTDITATKRDFSMTQYKSVKDSTGKDVLLCKWLESKQTHDCSAEDGYTFNNAITDSVTVQVPTASKEFAGYYMCFYIPNIVIAHPCRLQLQDETTETTETTVIVAVSVVIPVLVAIVVVCIICSRRHNKTRKREGPQQPLMEEGQIQECLAGFELPKQNLDASFKRSRKPKRSSTNLMDIMNLEINQGVDNSTRTDETTQSTAVLQMYGIDCPLRDQSSDGDCLVVGIGCTHVVISYVKLRSPWVPVFHEKYKIPPGTKTSTSKQLFDFIAKSIDVFASDYDLIGQVNAAITLPFPCHQTCLKKARIANWTREFRCEDVNMDIQDLLQTALRRTQRRFKVKIVAIVNEGVSTLMSVAHKTPECKICLIVGSGFNVCYVETRRRAGTSSAEEAQPEEIVFNTELGALGDNRCLNKFRTEFDRELDESSSIPGSQIFEKMVSWTYLGEIVRLVLKSLNREDQLLASEQLGCALFRQDGITSDSVAKMYRDSESPFDNTARILTELGVTQYTEEDLKIICSVCKLVCDRAAYLVAAALATLINRLNQPGVIVVVEGELNKKLPRFSDLLYSTANMLVKHELKNKFFLVSSASHGNFAGAALIADTAMCQERPAAASQP